MKVYFRPAAGRGNKYVDNTVKTIEKSGYKIVNKSHGHNFYPMIFLGLFWALFMNTKIFHFNWIVNNYARDNNLKNRYRVNLIKIWMKIMKKIGVKFIWTMHNKQPHDLKDSTLAIKFRNFLLETCDRIVIHSEDTKNFINDILKKNIEEKLFYIPHGHYIDNYSIEKNDLRKEYGIEEEDFVYLYFGIIRPYKNIDILINTFKSLNLKNAKLIIAGNPLNNKIKKEIKKLARDKNVILSLKYIKDSEINKIFKTSNIVVLPYDKRSVLNSGTMLLANSLKKPVIIPNISSVKDLTSKKFIHYYKYKNKEEKFKNLKNILHKIYKEYNKDRKKLKKEGEKAYSFLKKNNNWNIVKKRIKKLYSGLV